MKIDLNKWIATIVVLMGAAGGGYGVFKVMEYRLGEAEQKMDDLQGGFNVAVREFGAKIEENARQMNRIEGKMDAIMERLK